MSNQMFNREFLPMLQDGIKQFINDKFNDKIIQIKIKRDLSLENEKDAEKIDHIAEILFNTDNDFADYFQSNFIYEPDIILQMIIFCNEWLDENYGEDQILNWRRYNETYYVVSMMGYVYIQANKKWLVEVINDNKNELLALDINCLK
jgi:hypothetical protein